MNVLGIILTIHLILHAVWIWRTQPHEGFVDAVGRMCATLSLVMIGGFMWKGIEA